ncbi:MAG: Ig-like domain repeat protein [Clostridiales Family XIII bacterium]|jgi:hypothetical protein|nr:Ig-like domain repeat protein [Clostridiales Family XIII bacterium]
MEWVNSGQTSFTLTKGDESGKWFVQPAGGLGSSQAAPVSFNERIKITYNDETNPQTQDVTLSVQPKAEYKTAVITGEGGVSDTLTLTFKYPIASGLQWNDVAVTGAAQKSGANFKSSDGSTYSIGITPKPEAKSGDDITVTISLNQTAYALQISTSGNTVTKTLDTLEVARAIETAQTITLPGGYSTGALQFTLKKPDGSKDYRPVIAGEGGLLYLGGGSYTGPIKITNDSGTELSGLNIKQVVPVTINNETKEGTEYAWTWRVLFTLDGGFETIADGGVKVSLPGFAIEAEAVSGGITKGTDLSGVRYILDESGSNYLTDANAYQTLSDITYAGTTYVSNALALATSAEYSSNAVSKVMLSGANNDTFTELDTEKYTVAGNGQKNFTFTDDTAHSVSISDQLKLTLNEDWTRENGAYKLLVFFADGSVAAAKVTVSGITATYKLTLAKGAGSEDLPTAAGSGTSDGCYPAGGQVTITAGDASAGYKFKEWTQTDGAAITLPQASSGVLTMPAYPLTVQANYTDGVAPETTITPEDGSWIKAGGQITLSAEDSDITKEDGDGQVSKTYYKIGGGDQTEYTEPFTLSAEGENTIGYWSVDADGNTETENTATIGYDITAPAASALIKSVTYNAFNKEAGFTRFYTEQPNVSIGSSDAGSGVAKTEYLIDNSGTFPFADEAAAKASDTGWTTWTSGDITLSDYGTYYVLVRVTDTAGNVTIINSDGIVYYQNSGPETASLSFTHFGTADITQALTLNGNTVASVVNTTSTYTLTASQDYTVDGSGTLTLKPGYLNTLTSGAPYTLTVSYNPQGKEYQANEGNAAPDASVLTLGVTKAASSVALTFEPASGAADYETPITLTATLSGAEGHTPAGSVTFYDVTGSGDQSLGTGNIDGFGKATFMVSGKTLAAGSHTLKAAYSGDNDYQTSENQQSYTVTQAAQGALAIKDSSSQARPENKLGKTYGDESFTLTASGGSGAGDYVWDTADNENVVTVTDNEDGTATITILKAGSANITLSKNGDGNYAASAASASLTLTVAKRSVTITYAKDNENPDTKVYDGTANAPIKAKGGGTSWTINGTFGTTDFIQNDDVAIDYTGATATFTGANPQNVANGKAITFAGFTLSGTKAGSYEITALPQGVTADITKAAPTWKAGSPAATGITYGQTVQDATLSGIALDVDGEPLAGSTAWAQSVEQGAVPGQSDTTLNAEGYGYDVTFTPTDDTNYTALDGEAKIPVSKADQAVLTIKDGEIPVTNSSTVPKPREDGTLTLTAGGGSSSADYVWTSGSEDVATIAPSGEKNVGATVTFVKAGSTLITLSKEGDGKYNDAIDVSFTLQISEETTPPVVGNQTITSSDLTAAGVTLSWAKAEDEITPQSGLRYYVYQYQSDTDDLTTIENWEDAEKTSLVNTGGTLDIGTLDIKNLTANTSYFFNVIAADASGNKAMYTAVQVTTPLTVSVEQQGGADGKTLTTGILMTFVSKVKGITGAYTLPDSITGETPQPQDPDTSGGSAAWLIPITAQDSVANGTQLTVIFKDWTIDAYSYRIDETKTVSFYKPTAAPPQPETYALTVVGGTGSGRYQAGERVRITANAAESGQVFDGWRTSGGGTFADAKSATTTFTMPGGAVTVTAAYKNNAPGWVYDDGKWYLLGADGQPLTGWQWIDGAWYYLHEDGVMAVAEWLYDDGVMYYLTGNGAMKIGWLYDRGVWYYFTGNGAMFTHRWLLYKENWYYLTDNGMMASDMWIYYGNNWYYLRESGTMPENKWLSYGGSWYYLKEGGIMAASETLRIGTMSYRFDGSGRRVAVQRSVAAR